MSGAVHNGFFATDNPPEDIAAAMDMMDVAAAQAAAAQAGEEATNTVRDENRFIQDWPDEVLNPPGLVGDVVRFIRDASGVRQPKFALAAGLTICGALLGRGVKDYTGQRTNVYTLAVGGTSAGKNDPIRAIGKLVSAMSAVKMIAGEVTSDSALEILIDAFPVRLFLLDEVGQYLTTVKGAGQSNGHLRTVIPALTKCWSAAGGSFVGKARARDANGNWKPPKQISEPCVCLYGTSAPDVLFEAMTDADFADGSIPRFIPFISESRPMYETKPDIVVPDELCDKLLAALRSLGVPPQGAKNQDGTAADVPTAMLVEETEDATATFADLEGEKHENLAKADSGDKVLNLYGKIVENARRVALIVAALRNPTQPEIDKRDAAYGCALMLLAVRDMVATVRDKVAANHTERIKKKLRLIIRKAGADGITQSDLTRKTQSMKRQERDEAIQDLIEADQIVECADAGSGAKSISRYFYKR